MAGSIAAGDVGLASGLHQQEALPTAGSATAAHRHRAAAVAQHTGVSVVVRVSVSVSVLVSVSVSVSGLMTEFSRRWQRSVALGCSMQTRGTAGSSRESE